MCLFLGNQIQLVVNIIEKKWITTDSLETDHNWRGLTDVYIHNWTYTSETDANLYPPKRQLTKASEPLFDLEGGAQGQI